jgi:hypothetical protein
MKMRITIKAKPKPNSVKAKEHADWDPVAPHQTPARLRYLQENADASPRPTGAERLTHKG